MLLSPKGKESCFFTPPSSSFSLGSSKTFRAEGAGRDGDSGLFFKGCFHGLSASGSLCPKELLPREDAMSPPGSCPSWGPRCPARTAWTKRINAESHI